LTELKETEEPVIRKLVPSSQLFHRPTPMTEAEFRWQHNQDAMAVQKLSTGIRLSAGAQRKLEDLPAPKLLTLHGVL
ncbi:transaldolase, partial [Salmonella enterica]